MRKDKGSIDAQKLILATTEKNVELVLYDKKSLMEEERIPLEQIAGEHLAYAQIPEHNKEKYAYHFRCGAIAFADKTAHSFVKSGNYGEKGALPCKLAAFQTPEFVWEESGRPEIPYEDMVIYLAHVRGFTRHASSRVRGKGTFYGMVQKIPYLKELGITTVELQPIYEYEECEKSGRVNYWGYKEGYYYAPKAAYSHREDATSECREMIHAFHEQGMEVVLQFYFPKEFPRLEILNILRYWSYYYQVDGFHLMGEDIPVKELAQDVYLSSRKLWYYSFPADELYPDKAFCGKKVLASYQDTYMYDMRRFLKGDEGCVFSAVKHLTANPKKMGNINFITNYFGLTMMDMVSYEQKHNEENGEENRDGNDYNASWNGGAEGATRKKQILALRRQQYKNAFALLMLSQGTPLFFMGDEFGNSQRGNNNPYCQDNDVAWLNWGDLNKNKELYQYVKELIALRKNYKVFHMDKEYMMMDYLSCGYPDLSLHGREAYRPAMDMYSRQIGLLFCGKYAGAKEKFIYLAINMHWENAAFAYPKLKKEDTLTCIFSTGKECSTEEECLILPPRTICIVTIQSRPDNEALRP